MALMKCNLFYIFLVLTGSSERDKGMGWSLKAAVASEALAVRGLTASHHSAGLDTSPHSSLRGSQMQFPDCLGKLLSLGLRRGTDLPQFPMEWGKGAA